MEKSMCNKFIASMVLAACSSTALYAGSMGPAAKQSFRPFISGEAMYTWPQIDGFTANVVGISSVQSVTQSQGWGGRVAAGALYSKWEKYAISAEMGWGYYGHYSLDPKFTLASGATVSLPANTMSLGMDMYGVDVLAGIFYTQPAYDLFFKAGVLLQNTRMSMILVPAEVARDSTYAERFIVNGHASIFGVNPNVPGALPEIKLGGLYHIDDHWSATASWMYAFGGAISGGMPHMNFNPVQIGDISLYLNPPSLNAVLFGVDYRFS
jgi:hypothetical protein